VRPDRADPVLDHQGDEVGVRHKVAAGVCLACDAAVGRPEAIVLADRLHVRETE
jgi:hypothetical protein